MTEFGFNCYVIRIVPHPEAAPPYNAVEVYLGNDTIEVFQLGTDSPLTALLDILNSLPPCP